MNILYDTVWTSPNHMKFLLLLYQYANFLQLSCVHACTPFQANLSLIKSVDATLHQHEIEEAAKEAIVPMVYSESLSDAVVNLSPTINKLLLPMFKEDLVSVSEYSAPSHKLQIPCHDEILYTPKGTHKAYVL